MNEQERKEAQEAINAGKQALQYLYDAREKLGSAKNWGIYDMLGGGLISTAFKHSKMDEASYFIEQAKRYLLIFQRELKDVQVFPNLQMEISSFLSFADFFFDGLVADYLVQSKITEARKQVQDAIDYVESTLKLLKERMDEIQG